MRIILISLLFCCGLVFTTASFANYATLVIKVDNKTNDTYVLKSQDTNEAISASIFKKTIDPHQTVVFGTLRYTAWAQIGDESLDYGSEFTLAPKSHPSTDDSNIYKCTFGYDTHPVYEVFESNKVNVFDTYSDENCDVSVSDNTLTVTLTRKYTQ